MMISRDRVPDCPYVYVNQDGSVRECSPGEQAYLSTTFAVSDGGRPYIKSAYESRDGWGSQSGFMQRQLVPKGVGIGPVHPDYDALLNQLFADPLGSHRAAGDTIVTNADGSVICTPDPAISREERFERARRFHLAEQRRREELA